MNWELLGSNVGGNIRKDEVILRGHCSFCERDATFRQIGVESCSKKGETTVAIKCEGCKAIQVYSLSKKKVYPISPIKGLTNLPIELEKYYEEALRCISCDCPNGAMTLFRKLIHQLGIHYGLAEKNTNKKLYEIVGELKDRGHIQEKLRTALLDVKDFGNDGAHVNDNEPDVDQAFKIKHLIDSVLSTTVKVDQTLEDLKQIKEEGKE